METTALYVRGNQVGVKSALPLDEAEIRALEQKLDGILKKSGKRREDLRLEVVYPRDPLDLEADCFELMADYLVFPTDAPGIHLFGKKDYLVPALVYDRPSDGLNWL